MADMTPHEGSPALEATRVRVSMEMASASRRRAAGGSEENLTDSRLQLRLWRGVGGVGASSASMAADDELTEQPELRVSAATLTRSSGASQSDDGPSVRDDARADS